MIETRRLNDASKHKIRALLEDLFLARAMRESAAPRHRDLQLEFQAAQRELNRLRSAKERSAWITAEMPRQDKLASAPGTRTYADVVETAERRVEKLRGRVERAAKSQRRAELAVKSLQAPLERIAEHFQFGKIAGYESDPIVALDQAAA